MQFHPLEQAVHVERAVPVVEADHEPERDEVGRERVHEAPAEGVPRQRPSQRVDDPVELVPRLPQLFDAEGEQLRIRGRHLLPRAPRLRQHPAGPLGQYRHLRGEVIGREVGGERPAVAVEATRRRAHAHHARAVHEQARARETREDIHAQRLGLLAQPADDLAQRCDVVALVAHRGRGRKAQAAFGRQQIYRLFANRRAEWEVRILHVGEQLAKRSWVDDGAGE